MPTTLLSCNCVKTSVVVVCFLIRIPDQELPLLPLQMEVREGEHIGCLYQAALVYGCPTRRRRFHPFFVATVPPCGSKIGPFTPVLSPLLSLLSLHFLFHLHISFRTLSSSALTLPFIFNNLSICSLLYPLSQSLLSRLSLIVRSHVEP